MWDPYGIPSWIDCHSSGTTMGIPIDDDTTALVIDSGSLFTRSGFAGDDAPRSYISTVVGRHEYNKWMVGMDGKDSYIGTEAQNKRGLLSLSYPTDEGIVKDWADWAKIMEYIFTTELKVSSTECPVLMSDPPRNPRSSRETMTEVMFESFNVPGFYLAMQPLLSMYTSGRGTGIMLEVGNSVSHIAAVYEGYAIKEATRRIPFAGSHVTDSLAAKLNERGHSFCSLSDMEDVMKLKDRHSYVADSDNVAAYEMEHAYSNYYTDYKKRYELPDGQSISVGDELFLCNEGLFKPYLFNVDSIGIHEHVFESLMQCDMDTRRDMLANVIIAGGTTLTSGFSERLRKELEVLCPKATRVRIVTVPERKMSSWIGGSILASLSSFQSQWISKCEYEEFGPSIIHKKCHDL
ncbi:beta-actin-like protein 2 [Mactra antiquata]